MPRPATHSTLILILALCATTPLAAQDLGSSPPPRPAPESDPYPPDPRVIRQGGDTLADAVPVELPYAGSGTTCGYTDDHDEVCPFQGSIAPDVVYRLDPAMDMTVDIDLCGSTYDTKVYVYDADLELLGCNDDFYFDEPCGQYVSFLQSVPLAGGEPAYVVVDGHGDQCGEYQIAMTAGQPCNLTVPAHAMLEGEPPLQAQYQDCHNNGCNGSCQQGGEFVHTWQALPGDPHGELWFVGQSGWFPHDDTGHRDTDWFEIIIGSDGMVWVEADAEHLLHVTELGPLDCDQVAVQQSILVGPCAPQILTVTGQPGDVVWLWAAASNFGPPAHLDPDGDGVAGFAYQLLFHGLQRDPVAVQRRSFSQVRDLFR